jgi:hypothetical protein
MVPRTRGGAALGLGHGPCTWPRWPSTEGSSRPATTSIVHIAVVWHAVTCTPSATRRTALRACWLSIAPRLGVNAQPMPHRMPRHVSGWWPAQLAASRGPWQQALALAHITLAGFVLFPIPFPCSAGSICAVAPVRARDPRCYSAAGRAYCTRSTVAHVAAATAHADAISGRAGRCSSRRVSALSAVSALPSSRLPSVGTSCLTTSLQSTLAATPPPPRGRPRCVIVCIQGHGQRGAVD